MVSVSNVTEYNRDLYRINMISGVLRKRLSLWYEVKQMYLIRYYTE